MRPQGVRRLSLADLTDQTLRALIAQGEQMFVERKRQPPKHGIGWPVAAFANALGGWLLLGVEDDGTISGWKLPGRADAQSHIGHLLRAEVDPLPPYVAAEREVDGKNVVVIRVFESADTPHLLRATGAIPIRTPKGTEGVTDQRLLLELAQRGDEALPRAQSRLQMDVIAQELAAPDRPDIVAALDTEPYAIVRAAPLTLTPEFSDWATSAHAANACGRLARELGRIVGLEDLRPDIRPRGRGVSAHWGVAARQILMADYSTREEVQVSGTVAVDSGGDVGARLSRGVGEAGTSDLATLEGEYHSPVTQVVGMLLEHAGVYGRTTWRLSISLPHQDFRLTGVERQLTRPFYASAELVSPATVDELSDLTDRWSRELGRELGLHEWEPASTHLGEDR